MAQKVSSRLRNAWNACRSWPVASPSQCSTSEASSALAGCTISPAAASTSVTGDWASHSIRRSGTRSRTARAIARSRSTWPRPIGDDTHSAVRGRSRANSHGVTRGGGGTIRSTNALIAWLTTTGCRAWTRCPPPSIISASPPVSSASRSARPGGMSRSAVPAIASTGQLIERHSSARSSTVIGTSEHEESSSCSIVSASVSSPHSTMSSYTLVECGSTPAG